MLNKSFDAFENTLKKPEITMTPLIDMVFILLIFFVVTTSFTKETGIAVDKAKTKTARKLQKKLLLISIDKSGNYWYDKNQIELTHLVSLLHKKIQASEEHNIVLIPDKNGRVEPLITLMDKLREKNISRFSLGTQLSETP